MLQGALELDCPPEVSQMKAGARPVSVHHPVHWSQAVPWEEHGVVQGAWAEGTWLPLTA